YRRVLAIRGVHLPAGDRGLMRTSEQLALVLARQQRIAEADPAFRGALPRWQRIYRTQGAVPIELAGAQLRHAEWLLCRGALQDELCLVCEDRERSRRRWEAVIERGEVLHGAGSALVAQWRVPYARALAAAGRGREAGEQLRLAEPSLRREMIADARILREVDAVRAMLDTARATAGE